MWYNAVIKGEEPGASRKAMDDVNALRAALEAGAQRGRLAITGHDAPDVDSCAACAMLAELAAFWRIPAQIVLPTRADEQARRVLPRFGLHPDEWRGALTAADALVLADHHAPLHPGQVVAVIDHHPTLCPPEAPFVCIEPAGACAAMVYRLMIAAGMEPDARWEALAVTALYLDTMALRSAKIPPQEAAWARETAARLGMDIPWLEQEGLGLEDMTRPAAELARLSLKRYEFAGVRVLSSYVQTDAMTQERLRAILREVRGALMESGAALWVFLHQDPVAMRTTEFDLYADGRERRIDYDFLASRGKNVMPRVERELTAGGKDTGEETR